MRALTRNQPAGERVSHDVGIFVFSAQAAGRNRQERQGVCNGEFG
jgi:hypothetical protein